MNDVNISKMVASEGISYMNMEQKSNAANANAYLAPANMNPYEIIRGKSLLIEPSENGVPEPPSGGAAPKTKIPGSQKLEGAGGSIGARPEGTSRTGGTTEFLRAVESRGENRMASIRMQQDMQHMEQSDHTQQIKKTSESSQRLQEQDVISHDAKSA